MTDQTKAGFMESLGGIRKLQQDRIDPHQDRPRKKAQVLAKDINREGKSHSGLTSIPQSTQASWFHHGVQKKLQRRIRMAQIPVDASLDLHGYRQSEALHELASFFSYALDQQARFLIIVHGQGYRSASQPVLKPLVQHWLSEQESVLGWCPALAEHGGAGATYVYLRSKG